MHDDVIVRPALAVAKTVLRRISIYQPWFRWSSPPSMMKSKYCESTPRSQVNLSIRSVQILRSYDAPSLPRKDNRFDQELTSAGGESATYFTEPPDFHIFLRYPPLQI